MTCFDNNFFHHQPEQCCPSRHTKEDVNYLERNHADDINFEVTILDIILSTVFAISFVDSAGIEKHDPGLDQQNITPVDGVTNIITDQPVNCVRLKKKF